MTNRQEVAKTIMSQIKATDYWALGAWGANNYIATEYKGMNCLKFKVSGTKAKRGSWVIVSLNEGTDTYEVTIYRLLKGNFKIDNEAEGVYCDSLVQVIDGMVG